MKTKIGTSFGLALLLALGVIGAMLALGMFKDTGAFRLSNVLADFDSSATTPKVTVSPDKAGSVAQYTIEVTGADSALPVGNRIFVTFNTSTTVPSVIAESAVRLKANAVSGTGSANQLVNAATVAVSGREVAITIPDMDPGTAAASLGDNNIAVGAGITITFLQSAGITNPILAKAADSATKYTVKVRTDVTGDIGDVTSAGYAITSFVSFTPSTAARGNTVTVTGGGFTANCTICYIKLNPQSATAPTTGSAGSSTIFDGSGSIDSAGLFSGSFATSSTTGKVGGVDQFIWITDSAGNAKASATGFVQKAGATPRSASATPGGTVSVDLTDFTGGAIIGNDAAEVKVGSTAVATTGTPDPTPDLTVPTGGNTTSATPLKFVVPNTIPTGTHVVTVTDGTATATFSLEITPIAISASPTTAVVGQTITVSGSGFTSLGTVAANSITVGDITATHSLVSADNSGNVVMSFNVPDGTTTRTAGTVQVRVSDGTRVGAAPLTIPPRTLVLSPESGGRSTTVTASGSGYEAKKQITIDYGATGGVGAATVDNAGNWNTSFTVPTVAGIPSTNTVKATFTSTGNVVVEATGTHKVPGAVITINPTSAKSGDTITVTGSGFPAFVTLTEVKIGDTVATPVPGPNTGATGNFTASVLVPGATPGTYSVLVTAGGVTANAPITIVAAPPGATITPTATVFAGVVANADNLVRVWRYSNATQSWAFYDPRPVFEAANTLTTTTGKDIVWVNVKVQQTFQGQTLYAGWNLIVLQ